ncbi:LysR family transcriptional regulator [Tumebacillus sp. BK434]|uniref:LysR family transcriptional regulator n=1 Tax=Tumebacillus sp. BK434 TaxID=2512169 RepID=UPI0010E604A5|nr:LysR family transcriptional regulator [Tumebacillus sp. BK434]TCP53412.1 LysR family transcriptional regulator [Tumebacillus sp. BK434]
MPGEGILIEIRQFQTFKTVVDLKSFTKAAQALQYSQATITSHIQQLEAEMQTPLFDRLGKKIELTDFGRELYPYVEELLVTYSKIQFLSAGDHRIRGELRLGASETMTIYKLGPILSEYRRRYPEVNISLINDDCINLRGRIHAGEIDLAIVLEARVEDPNLTVEVYSEEPLVFIGGADLPIQHVEQADGECMIFTGKECSLRRFFETYLAGKGIDTANRLEFTSMEAIKQSVVSGLGISLIPAVSVEALLREHKVKSLSSAEGQPLFYAQVVYHKNKWLSPAHQKFLACMFESVEAGGGK